MDINELVIQEIESTTILPGSEHLGEFTEQAQYYLTDALRSNWRSAGLLYYYGFLNLAKVLLIRDGIVLSATMKTASAYHGLSAESQDRESLLDFIVTIHPAVGSRGKSNLFALLYEAVTRTRWPFQSSIDISLRDIAPFMLDVSAELGTHYSVTNAIHYVQSLRKSGDEDQSDYWLEFLTPKLGAEKIANTLPQLALQKIEISDMTMTDASCWLQGMHRSKLSMRGSTLLRSRQFTHDHEIDKSVFDHCVIHIPDPNHNWLFVEDLHLQSATIRWHPLLSDYIFSFALSTVLRYQPYVFRRNHTDQFLARAWCRQSPTTMLRYFLIGLTDPAILVTRAG